MNICFSLTHLELGGAQLFVSRLAGELAKDPENSIYIYDHWPESRNKQIIKNISPRVTIESYTNSDATMWITWKINGLLKILNFKNSYRYLLNKKKFARFLTKHKIDIVNSHMSYSDFICSEINLPRECKLIITLHGEYELILTGSKKEEFFAKITKSLSKTSAIIYTADKNLTPIESLRKRFNLIPFKINIGFSEDFFSIKRIQKTDLGYLHDDFIIGMVSRGIPDKGWDTAISVVKQFNTRHTKKIHLICIGDGSYLRDLINAEKDNFIKLIQFEENFQDYFSFYALFDLFIFPSRFPGESVPNVIIESLFWKIPIIASEYAEIPSMINAGSLDAAGITISLKDPLKAIQDFLTSVELVFFNDGLLKKFASNSEKAFVKYKMQSIAQEYMGIFKNVL